MSAGSIFGYGLLFFILLLLTAAHLVFVLIFFITIIAVIIHKVKQRKKSKINSRALPEEYSPTQTPKQTLSRQNYTKRIYTKPINHTHYNNEANSFSSPPLLKKEEEKITDLINKTKTMQEPQCFTHSNESNSTMSSEDTRTRISNNFPNSSTNESPPVF